ncbi:MAG: type II secretion system F family protein [Marinobacter sp.]|nr:type II secretion system F family protein [Marinobacter sp.]
MVELWFVLAAMFALAAVWMLLEKAPQWYLRARIHARLYRVDADDEPPATFLLARALTSITNNAMIAGDFSECQESLDAAGYSPVSTQLIYLVAGWLVPAALTLVCALMFGAIGGLLALGVGFIGARRLIRNLGHHAEFRQNLEAIELCHLTRMMMEAGVSLERSLRIIERQARPVIPMLARRLNRFNRMMEAGAERSSALQELIGSNKRIPVLRNYVSLMKQSGKLGSGVAESLTQIVEEGRRTERNRVKEATNRIGAKMTVVMMVFMLPSLFILIGGPAMITLMESFK